MKTTGGCAPKTSHKRNTAVGRPITSIDMRLDIHGEEETVVKLTEELPNGVDWAEYLLECVEMRKRVEGRDLVLTEPDVRDLEDKQP